MKKSIITLVCSLVWMGACATGETIDDTGTPLPSGGGGFAGGAGKVDNPTGGVSAGGVGNTGGGVTFGGAAGVSGAGGSAGSASGGSGGGNNCLPTEKFCGGVCIPPSPGVGCSLTACMACPTVANANAKCTGDQCDFDCIAGFAKSGGGCVATGVGGGSSGGAGGTGGSPGGGGVSGGGTGGATGCPAPCDPSDTASQFVCAFFCATQGGFGLCAPVVNCCVCGS